MRIANIFACLVAGISATVIVGAQVPIDAQIVTRLTIPAGISVGMPGGEEAWLDVLQVERHAEPQDVIVEIITDTRTITRRFPGALSGSHRRLSIPLHEDPALAGLGAVFSLLIDCTGVCSAAATQRQADAPWRIPVIVTALPAKSPTYTR